MFEKEAEEYVNEEYDFCYYPDDNLSTRINAERDWQNGAEFGYNKAKKELKDAHKESVETQNEFIIKLQKELEEEKKLNAEIKARFVKCNTCTDEMKSKCLMFTENLCEGERCEELIDIVSLVNKSDLERKIEVLEKANEWHYMKDGNPNNENDILCQISKDEVVVGYYHTVAKRYFTIDGQDLYNVIAWKEIVLPELKESE